ncbi:MAG: 4-coumarate--CoA ligase family protein [Caldilinea sp. CFX5]|nr:4-coumarate--CoA ligase family protein [Caldilinea sp. CFX5]
MIVRSPYPDVAIPEMPFTQFVYQRAQALATKPALIDGPTGRMLTYGQLAGAIRLVAASLAQRGLQKGDVFAIYSPNLPEYAVAFHAVATAGGTVTTVNPLYTVHELTHQLKDAGAKYLLTIPQFMVTAQEAAKAAGLRELFVFGEAEGATPFARLLKSDGQLPPVAIDPHKDIVVLPYSSGTTGLPKGVMLTHYNLTTNIAQLAGMPTTETSIIEDDVVMGILPFFHIYGMMVIMNYALYMGATVVSMPRFDMEQFLQLIQQHKVTYANLVPPIILGLAKHPLVDKYNLASLRCITSAAAPLGADVEQACQQRLGCVVIQGYGMTEASPATHIRNNVQRLGKAGSVGQCIPNTETKIVDITTGAALGPKQEGEVWIRGPQVMMGYLNNPTATANTVDRDGWLHTGDIGYYDEDGYFYIVDRLKELIKYKGFQVAPAELEALLLSHPAIADAAVIGKADEEAGEVPKAFIVPKGDVTADAILAFVAERVAPYKKIREIEVVTQIPKSASGKILRRVLADQERAKAAG